MYLTVMDIPVLVLYQFIIAILVSMVNVSGFKQENSDDDHIDNIYTYTTATLWILRISQFVALCILFAAYFYISGYPLIEKIMKKIDVVCTSPHKSVLLIVLLYIRNFC